jgi:hypothetical protein
VADPSTTYGPAQDRVTRAPIQFSDLGSDDEGSYGPTLLEKFKNVIPLLTGSPLAGTITLNPNAADFDLNRDSRHEAIHAALAGQNTGDSLIQSNNYGPIVQALMAQHRNLSFSKPQETAAYMGAYDPKQSGVPQDWRDEYIDKVKNALFKMNPKLAKMYQELSK